MKLVFIAAVILVCAAAYGFLAIDDSKTTIVNFAKKLTLPFKAWQSCTANFLADENPWPAVYNCKLKGYLGL